MIEASAERRGLFVMIQRRKEACSSVISQPSEASVGGLVGQQVLRRQRFIFPLHEPPGHRPPSEQWSRADPQHYSVLMATG